MNQKRILFYVIIMLTVFFYFSCSSIPKKEIDEAEIAIKESEKINANKYAPQELTTAKENLEAAKKDVIEKKNDEAKTKAIAAKDKGWQAYFLSISEFTLSEEKNTQLSMDAAAASHADVVVPDKFNQARGLFDEAKNETIEIKKLEAKLKKK